MRLSLHSLHVRFLRFRERQRICSRIGSSCVSNTKWQCQLHFLSFRSNIFHIFLRGSCLHKNQPLQVPGQVLKQSKVSFQDMFIKIYFFVIQDKIMIQTSQNKVLKHFFHPFCCGFFGFASTAIGAYFFQDDRSLLLKIVGIVLFLLSNQMMMKFQFNSYNLNGATITTAMVFLSQIILIMAWKFRQISVQWILGAACIMAGTVILKMENSSGKQDIQKSD